MPASTTPLFFDCKIFDTSFLSWDHLGTHRCFWSQMTSFKILRLIQIFSELVHMQTTDKDPLGRSVLQRHTNSNRFRCWEYRRAHLPASLLAMRSSFEGSGDGLGGAT